MTHSFPSCPTIATIEFEEGRTWGEENIGGEYIKTLIVVLALFIRSNWSAQVPPDNHNNSLVERGAPLLLRCGGVGEYLTIEVLPCRPCQMLATDASTNPDSQ